MGCKETCKQASEASEEQQVKRQQIINTNAASQPRFAREEKKNLFFMLVSNPNSNLVAKINSSTPFP